MWCVVVYDLGTSWMRRPWPTEGSRAKIKKNGNIVWKKLQKKKTSWKLTSRCCWNRASRLTCFLSTSVTRKDLQFGTWTDPSFQRHYRFRPTTSGSCRAKDLSANPHISLMVCCRVRILDDIWIFQLFQYCSYIRPTAEVLIETQLTIFYCYSFVLSSLKGGPSSVFKVCFLYHSTQCYSDYGQSLKSSVLLLIKR